MKHATTQVWVRRGAIVGSGLILFAVLYAVGSVIAGRTGQPVWPAVVTLTEWVVAIGLLPQLIVPMAVGILSRSNDPTPVGRKWILSVNTLSLVLLVAFACNLLARGINGLGWEPF